MVMTCGNTPARAWPAPGLASTLGRVSRWGGRRAVALTRAVLERDGYRCRWCGGTATTADHYPIPQDHGGPDTLDNLVAACKPCNSSRGAYQRALKHGHTIRTAPPPSRPW